MKNNLIIITLMALVLSSCNVRTNSLISSNNFNNSSNESSLVSSSLNTSSTTISSETKLDEINRKSFNEYIDDHNYSEPINGVFSRWCKLY